MAISIPRITQGTDTALLNAVNNVLSNLVGQINQPPQATFDMNNHRVTGVNWPSLDSDAVPLGYLKAQKPKATSTSIKTVGSGTSGPPGSVTFTPKVEGYAMFTIEPFATTVGTGVISEVDFTAFSIDETDLNHYGSLTAALASATTTFHPVITAFSRFGRSFAPGDYFIFNDASVIGTASTSWEICQIISTATVSATATQTWSISRGQLGSTPIAHGTTCMFYRLIPRVFTAAAKQNSAGIATDNGVPTFWEWAWANKTVVAVAALARGPGADGTTTVTNVAPTAVGTGNVAYPGLRTMNGAAYSLIASGGLSGHQTADQRIPVQSWHSIRTVYGILRTAPTGSALTVQVYYISPDRGTAGLIDTISFAAGSFRSYPSTSGPASQVMPYHATWTPPTLTALGSGFPPNVLPIMSSALDTNGNLTTTGTPSGGYILLAPDGELDFIITAVGTGTSAGANLTLMVQS